MVAPRVARIGRVGRAAKGLEALSASKPVDTSKLSHVARRRIASPPMRAVERAARVVGEAFQRYADRFVARVMREVVPPLLRQDAKTVEQIWVELNEPKVSAKALEGVFKTVDKASSDDLRVLGVRTGSVVRGAHALQSQWVRENTDLVRGTRRLRERVRKVVDKAVREGRAVDEIRKALEEQVGVERSRAELIARDQSLKLYGRIQEQRQRAAGFTQYVWTTSLDERVRPGHAVLDGALIDWDDPPVVDPRTGRRAHPGGDFQCRCSAVPYSDEDAAIANERAAIEARERAEDEERRRAKEARRAASMARAAARKAGARARRA